MEIGKALGIIRLLGDGVDPISGEVYGSDSPYQNAEVVRGLFVAIAALERVEEKERRKRRLPERAGWPWDDEEDELLAKWFEDGVDIKELAIKHKRTRGAIESRLVKLVKI